MLATLIWPNLSKIIYFAGRQFTSIYRSIMASSAPVSTPTSSPTTVAPSLAVYASSRSGLTLPLLISLHAVMWEQGKMRTFGMLLQILTLRLTLQHTGMQVNARKEIDLQHIVPSRTLSPIHPQVHSGSHTFFFLSFLLCTCENMRDGSACRRYVRKGSPASM